MNATKLYVITHAIIIVSFIICITIAAIHFNRCGLLWWYLLPALISGLEVKSDNRTKQEGNNNG